MKELLKSETGKERNEKQISKDIDINWTKKCKGLKEKMRERKMDRGRKGEKRRRRGQERKEEEEERKAGGRGGVKSLSWKGRNNTTEAYSEIVGKDSNTSP